MTEKPFYKSKKWWMTMLAVAIPFGLTKVGVNLTPDQQQAIIMPMIAYVIGQGVADAGKHKVKGE